MACLDALMNLLASREWLLFMVLLIAVGAFLFPDSQLIERQSRDDENKEEKP